MIRPQFKRFMALAAIWATGIVGFTLLALLLRGCWKLVAAN